jgi:solute carrier family 34 (sodium-dependent phosphate cotransporter)
LLVSLPAAVLTGVLKESPTPACDHSGSQAPVSRCRAALMAATAITGESAVAALEIALVHLLFNVFGVLAIFGTPALRPLPMVAAEWLAELAVWNRLVAMVYVLGGFFLIPAALIGLTSLWR